MSTKKVLNGKGIVTYNRNVDGGGAFPSFSSPFLSSFFSYFHFRFFSFLFLLLPYFLVLTALFLVLAALFFGPYRTIEKKFTRALHRCSYPNGHYFLSIPHNFLVLLFFFFSPFFSSFFLLPFSLTSFFFFLFSFSYRPIFGPYCTIFGPYRTIF